MKTERFEEELQRRPMRPIPETWRSEILRAAEFESLRASPNPVQTLPSNGFAQWISWLWPRPIAWATLAAIWLVLAVLNIPGPKPGLAAAHDTALGKRHAPGVFAERKQVLLELLNSSTMAANPPARSPATPPRSERREVKFSV